MDSGARPPEVTGESSVSAPPRRSKWRTALIVAVWIYLLGIIALWQWMIREGDRQWLATLVLFGPRWICALPLPVLALCAAIRARRLLVPLAAALAIVLWGIMGLEVHWPRQPALRPTLRVLTCNVEQRAVDTSLLAALIVDQDVDVVALQEVAQATPFIWPEDWHVIERHEFILASRHPIEVHESMSRPGRPYQYTGFHFTILLPAADVPIVNLHLESPRRGLEAVLSRRQGLDFSRVGDLEASIRLRSRESEDTQHWASSLAGPKLIVGDFNMPVDSVIFRRDWSGYSDAFSQVGLGFGFTKSSEKDGWSYGARIDHVLTDHSWRVQRCVVAADVGSDHRPLMADLELISGN